MAAGRFLFVSGVVGPDRSTWSGQDIDQRHGTSWYAWRLLGGNNRELGRAAYVHASLAECRDAALVLRGELATLETSLTADVGTGLWSWRLSRQGVRVAGSSRSYQRQRESHYNLAQFRSAATAAEPGCDVLVIPSARTQRTAMTTDDVRDVVGIAVR